jgi:PAS domain-containing protein
MLLSIASISVLIGCVCSCFAIWIFSRFRIYRASATSNRETAEAAIRFRDALLANCPATTMTLDEGAAAIDPKASALLQAGMAGADAKRLAGMLDGLLKKGKPFQLNARSATAGTIAIRGAAIEGRAVLFLEDLRTEAQGIDYRAVLDAIPIPVWTRDSDQALAWANRSFLRAVATNTLQEAIASNASLGDAEGEISIADDAATSETRRIVTVGERKRIFNLGLTRLKNAGIAGCAIDVTDLVEAEIAGKLNEEASCDLLDGIPLAVAVFGKDQGLSTYNDAYANLWDFGEEWLDSKPTMGEILDRLRETKRLPEQSDFQAWKRGKLRLFEDASRHEEEFWHLPGGRSLRVVTKPHLLGGIYMLVEDVTAHLRLEASFRLLTQVQKATLDTIEDGIAIFGPDGRLILHNKAFSKLWHLTEDELADQPHFTKVAILVEARLGQDSIWSIVSAGLTSSEPERCSEWGKTTRADGRVISLSMSRLPNGATIVTFADLTDFEKFEALQRETPDVAA